MAFICFTLLVLPNSSNSKYLLVELDGSPDVDPGMEDASPVPAIDEDEEGPDDDVEDQPIAEDIGNDDVPKPKPRSVDPPRSVPVPPSNLQGGYNDEEAVPEDDEEEGREVPPKPRSAVPKPGSAYTDEDAVPKGYSGNPPKGGYRSKPAPKNKAGKKPGGKGKQTPPITDPKQCTEGKKCVTNAGGKDPQGGSSGRWWNACQAYPLCVHPNYFGCYYTWGPNTFCMYG